MDYSLMLLPGRIGSMELKNRVVFPAMDAGLADNEGNERLARYMARRAEGGCGLLFVEVSAVHPSTSALGEPRLYDDRYIPSYKAIADAVHAAGGKVGVQLWHAGRQLFAPDFDEFPANWPQQIVSCSAIPCSEVVPFKPRELSTEEVYEIIEAYGDAAVRAQAAGFDCVNTTVLAVEEGSVRVRFDGREHVIPADAVVCALGARSNNEVVELLDEMGLRYAVVGDANRPGKILTAVREANRLARSI